MHWWHAEDGHGLWAATALALIFAVAAILPLTPHDLWFHLRLGQQMLETHALVTTDIFSYTRFGEPYFNNAWLGELALYGIWVAGGAPLLVLTRAVCVVYFYAIFLGLAWRASGSERWSAWFSLFAALASFPHWQLRPQTFVLPIFAFYVVLLMRYLARGRASLFWLPLLMIAWVNLHGSFVFGLLLIGLAIAGEIVQRVVPLAQTTLLTRTQLVRLIVWGIVTCAAILVNPLGMGMLEVVLEIGRDPSIQGWVLEWLPANAREFPASVFFALVWLFLLGAWFSHARGHAALALWALTFIGLGWSAYRNALWASALMTPLLAMLWRDISARVVPRASAWCGWQTLFRPKRLGLLRALIGMALLSVMLLPFARAFFFGDNLRAWVSADTPIDAVNYLRENDLRGRVYHEIGAGSYLMWALWPQQQVFVDSRINLYPAAQWRDYFAILSAQDGFEEILDKYQVEYVLADSFWMPQLITALQKRERTWRLVFENGTSFLFQRR